MNMEMQLRGKLVLVTGSTKGIGLGIVKEVAREGSDVIINGRDKEGINTLVASLKDEFPTVSFYEAPYDLSTDFGIQQLKENFPKIDVLVNNLGIFQPMNYFEIEENDWTTFFKTNVLAGNELAKFYLPKMLEQNFGRIIFIASEEAIMPSGEMPQYSMTKTMNLSLAKSLSKLTIGSQVTINTVMPGPTLTEGVEKMIEEMYKGRSLSREEQQQAFMREHRPMSQIQRLIEPSEIGRFIAFIASPLASSFSGEALRIDGGMVPTIV